jgi:CRISPR system Cascade subunit CasA
MNLVSDPWIPVVCRGEAPGNVTLVEPFTRGKDIIDLAVRPHERVAIMRLLICIAQAALDGPVDRSEWLRCRDRLPQAAETYLRRWRHAFELFGDGHRFLQVPNLTPKPGGDAATLVSKLDVALATGNNPTLFDNGGGTERKIAPPRLAVLLLTFQCFSPGGLISIAQWSGQTTRNKSEHAPCISRNMLHALVRGRDVSETLYMNLLHRQQVEELMMWGQPVWECMPESPNDEKARTNATNTYLGRLVPVARAVHLDESSSVMLYGNALTYPKMREPTATEVIIARAKGTERTVLSASLEKATWRELNAITVKSSKSRAGGPLALQNLTGETDFDCWAGGLVASSNAKVLDSIESVFHVPAVMLDDTGHRTYEEGVRFADSAQAMLFGAIDGYWREYGRYPGGKLPKEPSREQRAQSRTVAGTYFWTLLEQGVPDLLAVVEQPGMVGIPANFENTAWGKLVVRTRDEAFRLACPVDTPRQVRAYSKALPLLKKKISNDANSHRSRSRNPAQILA